MKNGIMSVLLALCLSGTALSAFASDAASAETVLGGVVEASEAGAEAADAVGDEASVESEAAAEDKDMAEKVADVAAQCAKRYAALKGCDRIPSFGGSICRKKVEAKYSHLACQLVN